MVPLDTVAGQTRRPRTGEALAAFTGDGTSVVTTLRPGGHEFVVTSAGNFYDAATGVASSAGAVFPPSFGWDFTASADQRHVYGISSAVSPMSLKRAQIGFSGSAPALAVTGGMSASLLNGLVVSHLAVTPDGSKVCFPDHRAGSTSTSFSVFGPGDTGSLVSQGTFLGSTASDYTRAVDIAPDGRVLAIAGYTLDCYDALSGNRTHSYSLPSAQASASYVTFSGDGERALLTGSADASTKALWAYPSR
jgi:WD40 repeat protein